MPTSAVRRRPAWAGRNYTLLTASAVVTNLGSHGALIAAAFAVLGAGGDGGDVGLVAAARTLPLVLFLLIGGAVADRLPRHRVMVAANVLNCASQAAFAALVLVGEPQLWQMMLLSGLGGAGQAFFNPAAEGMLLSSVDGEQAGRAFAVFRMAMHGATLGGRRARRGDGRRDRARLGAGGGRGGLRGRGGAAGVPRREAHPAARAGRRHARRSAGRLAGVHRPAVAVGHRRAVLHSQRGRRRGGRGLRSVGRPRPPGRAGPWGVALAFFGGGTVAGALLMTRWQPRRLLLVGTLCVFPLALPSAALAVPVPVVVLCAVMFLTGLSVEVFGVSWMTALHQEIPEEKLSRVSAYDWFGSVALVPAAMALAGPAETAFGRPEALWGCAALVVVVTAAVLTVPDVRNLRRRTKQVAGAVQGAQEQVGDGRAVG